jgi:hypothetical protein
VTHQQPLAVGVNNKMSKKAREREGKREEKIGVYKETMAILEELGVPGVLDMTNARQKYELLMNEDEDGGGTVWKSFLGVMKGMEKRRELALEKYKNNKTEHDVLVGRYFTLKKIVEDLNGKQSKLAPESAQKAWEKLKKTFDELEHAVNIARLTSSRIAICEKALAAYKKEDLTPSNLPRSRMAKDTELNDVLKKCEEHARIFDELEMKDVTNGDLAELNTKFQKALKVAKSESQNKACLDAGCDVSQLTSLFAELEKYIPMTSSLGCVDCGGITHEKTFEGKCATHYYTNVLTVKWDTLDKLWSGLDKNISDGNVQSIANQIQAKLEHYKIYNEDITAGTAVIPDIAIDDLKKLTEEYEYEINLLVTSADESSSAESSLDDSIIEAPSPPPSKRVKKNKINDEVLDFMLHTYGDDMPLDCVELLKLMRDGSIGALQARLDQHRHGNNGSLYAIVCSVVGSTFAPIVESTHSTWDEATECLKQYPQSEYILKSVITIK